MNTKIRFHHFLILLFIMLVGCRTDKPSNPELKAKSAYIEVEGGKIWYGIMGEGTGTPLLCLHGGPGGTSRGYYNLSEIAEEHPVIMFDQLGTGRSDHHQDTTLLKPALFVEQVRAVKEELKLKEFYLVGGSWGAALALEYYSAYPDGVKGIIFNSPYFSTPVWTGDAVKLIAELPDSIQEAIHIAERDSVFDADSYIAANRYFLSQHGRRNPRVQHPYDTVPSKGNSFIYNYMWGPTEFTARGTLRNYDNLESLKKVTVPVLFTTGEFDEARPETVEGFSQMVPSSDFVVIPGAGHSTLNDNRPAMVEAIQGFIADQKN